MYTRMQAISSADSSPSHAVVSGNASLTTKAMAVEQEQRGHHHHDEASTRMTKTYGGVHARDIHENGDDSTTQQEIFLQQQQQEEETRNNAMPEGAGTGVGVQPQTITASRSNSNERSHLTRDGNFILYQQTNGRQAIVRPQTVEQEEQSQRRFKWSACCSCLDNVPLDLEEARRNWRQKFSSALDKIKNSKILRRGQMDSAFFIIARLFAHEDVVSQLYKYFDRFPVEFRFYIPQLMTFLVHGLPENQGPLEVFLMDRCERSLLFAHRVYWFLNSFAYNVPYSSEVSGAITRGSLESSPLQAAVEMQGSTAARRFIENGPGKVELTSLEGNETHYGFHVRDNEGDDIVEKDRRAWRMRTSGESTIGRSTEEQNSTTRTSGTNSSSTTVTTSVTSVVASPELNTRGRNSDIEAPWSAITDEGYAAFRGTIDLVDELINLSSRLIPVPFDQRNSQLREDLESINNAFLPSSSVYVPVGNPYNRLLWIHSVHSFCFKTKERVPYLTVLEVADLDPRLYGETLPGSDDESSEEERDAWSNIQQSAAAAGAAIRRAAGQMHRYFKTKYDEARMRRGRQLGHSSDSDDGYKQSHRRPKMKKKRSKRHLKQKMKTGNGTYVRHHTGSDDEYTGPAGTSLGDVELATKPERKQSQNEASTAVLAETKPSYSDSSSSTNSNCVPSEPAASTAACVTPSHDWQMDSLQQSLLSNPKPKRSSKRNKSRRKKRAKQQKELRENVNKEREHSDGLESDDAYTEEEIVSSSSESDAAATRVEVTVDAEEENEKAYSPNFEISTDEKTTVITPNKSKNENRLGMWGKASEGSGKRAARGRENSSNKQEDQAHDVGVSGYTASAAATPVKPRGDTNESQDTAAEDAAIEHELNIGLTDFEHDTLFSDVDDAENADSEVVGVDSIVKGGARFTTDENASAANDETSAVGKRTKTNQAGEKAHETESVIYVAFPEKWRDKEAKIRKQSPYGNLKSWRLMPVIVKANDDLRQEQFVCQLLRQLSIIWQDAGIPVWLRAYDILATCRDGGLIEAIPDTISLDSLKRGDPNFTTLSDFFERYFNRGKHGEKRLRIAKSNFARSLAAYSITCYLLQIKDRHNGNILLDANGHLVHIDFGFLLTNSPGGNMGFEAAPFKLTQEFVDVLGGPRSRLFQYYRSLCGRAFLEARRHRQKIMLLVEMMLAGNRDLPCFVGGQAAVLNGLHDRFKPDASRQTCVRFVNDLIDKSMNNWRTRWYDKYQRWAMGIL